MKNDLCWRALWICDVHNCNSKARVIPKKIGMQCTKNKHFARTMRNLTVPKAKTIVRLLRAGTANYDGTGPRDEKGIRMCDDAPSATPF